MGVEYSLVNQTKRETLTFAYMPVGKKREIAGNPASAALVAWYMLEHPEDDIHFVSDSDGEWPFKTGNRDEVFNYLDVTHSIIEQLVAEGILRDDGMLWQDEEEPELYLRQITNIW